MADNHKRYGPEDLIAVLNRYRHDWMNDLQVLFGYIQLNRQDKIKEYIARLSDKLTRESLVAKLADPDLVAYLIRFRATNDRLHLEVVPAGEIDLTKLGLKGRQAGAWIPAVIDAFAAAVPPEETDGNRLVAELDWDGERLTADFRYTGACRRETLSRLITPVLEEAKASGHDARLMEEDGTMVVRLVIG